MRSLTPAAQPAHQGARRPARRLRRRARSVGHALRPPRAPPQGGAPRGRRSKGSRGRKMRAWTAYGSLRRSPHGSGRTAPSRVACPDGLSASLRGGLFPLTARMSAARSGERRGANRERSSLSALTNETVCLPAPTAFTAGRSISGTCRRARRRIAIAFASIRAGCGGGA